LIICQYCISIVLISASHYAIVTPVMTIQTWLKKSITQLTDANVDSARLDAEILLADELNKDRSWIIAHSDFELSTDQIAKLINQVNYRSTHLPLAYIRGHQEFYGRDFLVTPAALTPRPETETMLGVLLEFTKTLGTKDTENIKIIDIGTGTGCIAITAKLELPTSVVYATEISKSALSVAKQNASKHEANVIFMRADLMSRLGADVVDGAILCCNLPYVPDNYPINKAAKHEPAIALFSGKDGLSHYQDLFSSLAMLEQRGQYPFAILTESLVSQHEQLAQIAAKVGFKLQKTEDLIQFFSHIN